METVPLAKQKNKGCFYRFIFIACIIWILGVSVMAQSMTWIFEQTLFESSILLPDLRWLIGIAYSSIISLPLFMISFLSPISFLKKIFKFWGCIGLLGFFLIIAKTTSITNAYLVACVQIAGIWLLFISLFIWNRKGQDLQKVFLIRQNQDWGMALIFSAILGIPWVLWGSLGSVVDVILNIIVAISSAVFLLFVFHLWLDNDEIYEEASRTGTFFWGLIIFVGLIIFSTVLGQNGQQWLLVFSIPLISWTIPLFLHREEKNTQYFSLLILIAFLIVMPLLWFDPDELNLIIGSGKGEILSWVNKAVITTVGILISLMIFSAFIRLSKFFERWIYQYQYWIGMFSWVMLIVLYFGLGNPGFFGETYFVILKDQVDVTGAKEMGDYRERRNFVYETKTKYAEQSQKDLRTFLEGFNVEYHPFYLINAVEVKSGPILRFFLANRDDVDRILDNPVLRPLPEKVPEISGELGAPLEPDWNLKLIGADRVWNELDIRGEAILIGQSDSGMDGLHPALSQQYAGYETGDDYHWYDPWYYTEAPTDLSGHGTHTLGTILGKKVGVAPNAQWIGCVNLARNLGNPGYYLTCMEFLFAPFPQDGDSFRDGIPELGAHIINNSWGCPEIEGCDSAVFEIAVQSLRQAGIFVVASAGNGGYSGCGSIRDPLSIYADVFSVGAIDESGSLAAFSSIGPVTIDGSNRLKPDLVAPGVDILSAMPNNSYSLNSGTSMAGPHVAGVVALMWSANSDLIGNISKTEEIIKNTADPFQGLYPDCIGTDQLPNNAVGYGVLNAFRAVEAAMNSR
ncbi:MAG: peptidase S8 [Chloroflexi bacterium HGW-Chloroflexi-10]|nr:MAG: peptidase S8 [Chloroflexi bacterium HGW-Chloroflexi-10]